MENVQSWILVLTIRSVFFAAFRLIHITMLHKALRCITIVLTLVIVGVQCNARIIFLCCFLALDRNATKDFASLCETAFSLCLGGKKVICMSGV